MINFPVVRRYPSIMPLWSMRRIFMFSRRILARPKDEQNNAVIGGQVKLVECDDCIVRIGADRKMVVQGLEGYIVAEQGGVFLICKKTEEQRIKEFSEGM